MLSESTAERIIYRLGRWPSRTSGPVVMRDSPDAARYMTGLEGWVSRDGMYYGVGKGAESTARYAGCTHQSCRDCGKVIEKGYLICDGCRDLVDEKKFQAMPRQTWDGTSMVYSQTRDEYFQSPIDAEDYLEEGQTLEDLQLVICKPNGIRPLDPEYCSDDLPEDEDSLPAEVYDAMDAFNKAVAGIVLSWTPGKYALDLTASRHSAAESLGAGKEQA